MHGIDVAGLLGLAAQQLIAATGHDPTLTAIAILWGSAIFSALVDNIPFVAAMIPLIREVGPQMGGPEHVLPLWWALVATIPIAVVSWWIAYRTDWF